MKKISFYLTSFHYFYWSGESVVNESINQTEITKMVKDSTEAIIKTPLKNVNHSTIYKILNNFYIRKNSIICIVVIKFISELIIWSISIIINIQFFQQFLIKIFTSLKDKKYEDLNWTFRNKKFIFDEQFFIEDFNSINSINYINIISFSIFIISGVVGCLISMFIFRDFKLNYFNIMVFLFWFLHSIIIISYSFYLNHIVESKKQQKNLQQNDSDPTNSSNSKLKKITEFFSKNIKSIISIIKIYLYFFDIIDMFIIIFNIVLSINRRKKK